MNSDDLCMNLPSKERRWGISFFWSPRTKNSLSSRKTRYLRKMHIRSLSQKSEQRRTRFLQSSIFGLENRNLPSSFFGSEIRQRLGRRLGGGGRCGEFFEDVGGKVLRSSRLAERITLPNLRSLEANYLLLGRSLDLASLRS